MIATCVFSPRHKKEEACLYLSVNKWRGTNGKDKVTNIRLLWPKVVWLKEPVDSATRGNNFPFLWTKINEGIQEGTLEIKRWGKRKANSVVTKDKLSYTVTFSHKATQAVCFSQFVSLPLIFTWVSQPLRLINALFGVWCVQVCNKTRKRPTNIYAG